MTLNEAYFKNDKSEFLWSSSQPWCIIMSLIGKKDELVRAIGCLEMHNIRSSPYAEDKIAQLLATQRATYDLIEESADLYALTEIKDIRYFFGILKNKINNSKA